MPTKLFARSIVWRGAMLALLGLTAAGSQAAPPPPLGQVKVIKHLKAQPGGPPLSNMTFSVTANCSPAATTPTQTVTAGPGAGQVTFAAPIGATCTIIENTPLPPFPAAATQYCASSGMVPTWLPPSFHPGTGTVLVNSPNQVVQLRNEWKCAAAPQAKLTVMKRISNAGGTPLTNMTFSVTVNCTSPSSTATQPVNNGTGIGSTVFNVAAGSTCTVTENAPLPPLPSSATAYCAAIGGVAQWNPPSFGSGGATVSVPPAGATVYLLNSWTCAKSAVGKLEIIKELTTIPTPVLWPASSWKINVSCTPAASASSVTINTTASGNAMIVGSGPILTAPVGATCTLSEPANTLPPFPTNIVGYCAAQGGKVPLWNPPIFVPANPVAITSGVTTVRVKNSWRCA